jgi:hypothetical protein
MPCKKDIAVVRAIGIDTGKNTLHMIGLDEKGAIVPREKSFPEPNCRAPREHTAMPHRDRSCRGHSLHVPGFACA